MKKLTQKELKELINNNSAESVYVDFKQKWHSCNTELLHDILCLSNADYDGDRFLLFGVNDQGKLIGLIPEDNFRKKDHQLQDLINNANFSSRPDFSLYTLSIDQKEIDIIQIANTCYKPYFLLKSNESKSAKENQKKKKIPAGVIYTRNGSSNTPIDKTATECQIERMWKERFGIDETPVQRMKKYLLDFKNWKNINHGCGEDLFYDLFPEFTIKFDYNSEDVSIFDSTQEWTRGEIGNTYSKNSAYFAFLYYHQTLIHRIHLVSFDNHKKVIVAPDWSSINQGRFYYYLENSLRYHYQKHRTLTSKRDHSKKLLVPVLSEVKLNFTTYDIPVLKNEEELEEFLLWCGGKTGDMPVRNDEPDLQNEIWLKLLEQYEEWKKKS